MNKAVSGLRKFWLSDVSFLALLFMLFFIVFVAPILMETKSLDIIFLNVFFLLLFLAGIFSSYNKTLYYITTVLFILHVILKTFRFIEGLPSLYLLERIMSIINTLLFIHVNFRLLFRDNEVTTNRIIGAINVYLLFALLGVFMIQVAHVLAGSSLGGDFTFEGGDKDFPAQVYYSMVSLTTVGYGDIYPIHPITRSISVLLSAIGILYPAVIISRLVSLGADSKRKRGAEN
jgi:hypothetical protein